MESQSNNIPQAKPVNVENPMMQLIGNSAQLTQQVTASATETANRASQSVANITNLNAKTISDMGNAMSAQFQARSQVLARENPWKGLAETAVKAADDYYEKTIRKANNDGQKNEENARIQAQTREKELRRFQETDASEANAAFEETFRTFSSGDFTSRGSSAFINDIQDVIASKKYLSSDEGTRILSRAYNAASEFDAARRKQALESSEKLQTAVGKQREEEWMAKTLQVSVSLGNATNGEQMSNYLSWFEDNVLKGIAQDSTLTQVQRIEVTAKMLGSLREGGMKDKLQNYEGYQRIQREYTAGMPELMRNMTQFATDNDLVALERRNELLFAKYPKLRQFYKAPGEVQEQQLKLRELGLRSQELRDKELERNPLTLSGDGMTAITIMAILDQNTLTQLETTPAFRGATGIITAAKEGQAEWVKYSQRRAEFDVIRAKANEELARLNVSTVDDVLRLQRDITNNSTMSPEQSLVLQQQSQILGVTPEQIAAAQSNDKAKRDAARVIIERQIAAKQGSLRQLRDARVQVLNAQERSIETEFPRLRAAGLLGRSEAELRKIFGIKRPALDVDIQRRDAQLLQLRENNQRLNNEQGQTLNFPQGSQPQQQTSAPVVYTGKLATGREGGNTVAVLPLKPGKASWFPLTSEYRVVRGDRRHWGTDIGTPTGTPTVT